MEQAEAAIQIETARKPKARLAWDDTPLRTKLSLLMFVAVMAGAGIGWWSSQERVGLLPTMLGLLLSVIVLLTLAHTWVAGPIDRLSHWLRIQGRSEAPFALKQLPVNRRDEVGQLAKAVYEIASRAIRHHNDARQLRRTMDHRVEIETKRACSRLADLAMRDGLTDLGNRRFLDSQLEPLFEASRSSGTPLTCVVIDVDNFKAVNDALGHSRGDDLLILLASLIRAATRPADIAARLGGDEFVMLLPGAEPALVRERCERVRKLFNQQVRVSLAGCPEMPSLSMGVAGIDDPNVSTGSDLVERADSRLYRAKERGRDRTCDD